MKKFLATAATVIVGITLTACFSSTEEQPEDDTPTPPVVDPVIPDEPEEVRFTNNVTYTGIVRPAGVSIYQEGTHRLVKEDGSFILLEGDGVDLNGYVGENTEVYGSVRPTVEEGGMFMLVKRAKLMAEEQESEDEEVDSEVEEQEPEPTEDQPEQILEPEPTDQDESEEPTEPKVIPEVDVEASDTPQETGVLLYTAQQQAIIATMAKEDISADRWTQQYCSSHIGFCIPIHKNWYWKSFGSTTDSYWHVEISTENIDAIGKGVIYITLNDGPASSAVTPTNALQATQSWDNDTRHFSVIGPESLQGIIEYIALNLTAQPE